MLNSYIETHAKGYINTGVGDILNCDGLRHVLSYGDITKVCCSATIVWDYNQGWLDRWTMNLKVYCVVFTTKWAKYHIICKMKYNFPPFNFYNNLEIIWHTNNWYTNLYGNSPGLPHVPEATWQGITYDPNFPWNCLSKDAWAAAYSSELKNTYIKTLILVHFSF